MNDEPRHDGQGCRGRPSKLWYLLLLLPYLALLYPPLYAFEEPRLFGFPFFYWYQFAWVFVAAILTALVYVKTRRDR